MEEVDRDAVLKCRKQSKRVIFIEHSGLFVMTIFASRIVYRSYKTVLKILHHETRKGVVRMQNGISITAVCRCLEERRYWSRCLHSLMIR